MANELDNEKPSASPYAQVPTMITHAIPQLIEWRRCMPGKTQAGRKSTENQVSVISLDSKSPAR